MCGLSVPKLSVIKQNEISYVISKDRVEMMTVKD